MSPEAAPPSPAPSSASEIGKKSIGRLRGDLKIYPSDPDFSGKETWALFDPVADRYFKADTNDHAILARLNKVQTFDELTERLNGAGIQTSQEHIVKFIQFLTQNGLIETAYGADAVYDLQADKIKKAMLSKWLVSAYLFLDIPLLRPDRFFTSTAPHVTKLFNKWTISILVLIALCGYTSILPRLEALSTAFWKSLDFQGIIGYGFAILLIKFVHECSHAYVAKAHGIRVRRMGVAFIVFIPRLYTDITDAWRIPDRTARACIDGAGIASELIIGGFAAIVWSNTVPGLANTISFYIFAVSAINTVFINGNPFIKYDGYYLLMDLVGIDNLYMRGVDIVKRGFRRYVFGIGSEKEPTGQRITGWRHPFMSCFAVSSVAYRIFLYTSIILIVYIQFTKIVGIMLFFLEAYLLMYRPLAAEYKDISRMRGSIKKESLQRSLLVLGALVLILFIPLPWTIRMHCETRPVLSQVVYAKEDGFLLSLNVKDGDSVKKGELLLKQENPFLSWGASDWQLQAEMLSRELDQIRVSQKRRSEQEVQLKRLDKAKETGNELARRQAQLAINAAFDGTFVLSDRHLTPGKWLSTGELIGEVFSPEQSEAIAYVPEKDVAKLKDGDKVSVSVNGSMKQFKGKITMINAVPVSIPGALTPILDITGGPLPTVRNPEDQTLRLQNPLYMLRISIDNSSSLPSGRTGTLELRKFYSPGFSAFRLVLSTLQKELAF